MWNEDFETKIYKSMKYVTCYCTKRDKVLVGMVLYPIVNIIGVIGVVVILSVFLLAEISPLVKVGALFVTGLVTLLPISYYKRAKDMMIKAGHTGECSRKVGRIITLHGGTYSPFCIMKVKEKM